MAGPVANINRLVPGLVEKPTAGSTGAAGLAEIPGQKFSDLFSNAINAVNELHAGATEAQNALLAGDPVELHEVMIKAEEAGLATDLILEIRNKLVSAYNEIMRMPV